MADRPDDCVIPGTHLTADRLSSSRRRYKELRAKWRAEGLRAAIRTIGRLTRRAGAVVDDGQEDARWALDHSLRRYRVRPLRPTDAVWWSDGREAVVVIDCRTGVRIPAPVETLPFPVSDDDRFGADVFAIKAAFGLAQADGTMQ